MSMDAAARAARRKVKKMIAQLGGAIEEERDGHYYTVHAIAPESHHWGDGLHEYVAGIFIGPWSYDEAWNDLLTRLVAGGPPEPCGPECEYWVEDEEVRHPGVAPWAE